MGRPSPKRPTPSARIDAGDFGEWLERVTASFADGSDIEVPCGDCRGCCSAGRFVHVTPADRTALAAIPDELLVRAPGLSDGSAVMGFGRDGLCPMLKAGDCAIYASRPATCRAFDCRLLAAAGLRMHGRWAERINERVSAWEFGFAGAESRRRHESIRAAATFIAGNARLFPGGRVPDQPLDLAALAVRVHSVLPDASERSAPQEIADAIVELSRTA